MVGEKTPPIVKELPILMFPRFPRRFNRTSLRGSSRDVDEIPLKEIIDIYGVKVTGEATSIPLKSRSLHIVLNTTEGKKILKRYKATVSQSVITTEHSILNYLATIDFPAPRLISTDYGEMLIRLAGHHYAMFDYLDGYFHYHDYLMLPHHKLKFIELSALALATLHSALWDFTPLGSNPEGFPSKDGDRSRDTFWYVAMLKTCQSEVNSFNSINDEDTISYRDLLLEYGDEVKNEIQKLSTEIVKANLPRGIIHGDYGPYNILIKRNNPVLILDFELARIDWRILDIAKSLPYFVRDSFGFSFNKARAYVKSYHSAFPLDPQEVLSVPLILKFIALKRLIVCWHRFHKTQAKRWLKEAKVQNSRITWIENNEEELSKLLL
jgi:Ser/Thr protein kinase RdoA (MazF antagonist)